MHPDCTGHRGSKEIDVENAFSIVKPCLGPFNKACCINVIRIAPLEKMHLFLDRTKSDVLKIRVRGRQGQLIVLVIGREPSYLRICLKPITESSSGSLWEILIRYTAGVWRFEYTFGASWWWNTILYLQHSTWILKAVEWVKPRKMQSVRTKAAYKYSANVAGRASHYTSLWGQSEIVILFFFLPVLQSLDDKTLRCTLFSGYAAISRIRCFFKVFDV